MAGTLRAAGSSGRRCASLATRLAPSPLEGEGWGEGFRGAGQSSQRHHGLMDARELRRRSSVPERLLWRELKSRRAFGLKFRRQHPIGPYVADFFCAALGLVVEVDGSCHEGRRAQDAARDAFMRERGIEVVRFTASEVTRDVKRVVEEIGRLKERRFAAD